MHASAPSWECGLRISCSPFSLVGGEPLLSSCVRRPRLLLVVAMQPLVPIFGIQLAGLLEHPAFSVGVIGWLIGGAVDLTRAIKYAIQTGRARSTSFEWLFPLTGSRASESGIDCRILGFIDVIAAPWCVTTLSAVGIFGIRSARIPRCVIAASQSAILARAKAGHECREGCHRLRLLLAEVPGKPLVTDVMLECC